MPISIRALRPSHPAFAGEVSGVDITRPIDREDVAAIEAGMAAYAVLVFRGQDLTDEQQLAFTLNFGGLERYKTPGHARKREDNRLGPGIADFSNLDKHGNIMSPEEIAAFRPVRQRLVRTHPVTGRKSLFLSAHAGAIVGWTVPEARMFLRDLTEHATQREFVYSHAWRPGDLVMWDNRATMHRARRFDRNEVRDVRRTTLAGDAPTVEQAPVA